MKEENILYNGENLLIKNTGTKIFLHTDSSMSLIDLVEGTTVDFRRRIEFKKKNNNPNKYVTFSYYITSTIVFSGYLEISPSNTIIGDISFQFLKENSTKILEAYYLRLYSNGYYIEYIITENIQKSFLESKRIETVTIETIEVFLFNIINGINNKRCIKSQRLIPYHISINQIFGEEKRILKLITDLTTTYPKLQEFIDEYIPFERKRKQNY